MINQKFPFIVQHRRAIVLSLAACVSVLWLSPVWATTVPISMNMAQQQEFPPQMLNYTAALKALQEGKKLYQQGTAESWREAIAKYNEALTFARKIKNSPDGVHLPAAVIEAETLNNLGNTYNALGEKQTALSYYEQAVLIDRAEGNRFGEADTLNEIGKIYDARGDKQKALSHYNQALLLWRAEANAQSPYNLSTRARKITSTPQIEMSDASLRLLFAARRGEASSLNNIAGVYEALGDKRKALKFFSEAASLQRIVWDLQGAATTLDNMARIYDSLGEKQKALNLYKQSMLLKKATSR